MSIPHYPEIRGKIVLFPHLIDFPEDFRGTRRREKGHAGCAAFKRHEHRRVSVRGYPRKQPFRIGPVVEISHHQAETAVRNLGRAHLQIGNPLEDGSSGLHRLADIYRIRHPRLRQLDTPDRIGLPGKPFGFEPFKGGIALRRQLVEFIPGRPSGKDTEKIASRQKQECSGGKQRLEDYGRCRFRKFLP